MSENFWTTVHSLLSCWI